MHSMLMNNHKPCLHGDSGPDPDPALLRLHGGKLNLNPDSDHACTSPMWIVIQI